MKPRAQGRKRSLKGKAGILLVGRWRAFCVGVFALVLAGGVVLAAPVAVASACPNELLRTGPGASLPDCRAYEQASPSEKNEASVEGFPDLLTTSTDGSSVTFFGQAGTGLPVSNNEAMQDYPTYLSRREGEAWKTLRLLPPQSFGRKAHFLGTTPDHRFTFVEASMEEGAGPTPGRGLFMVDTATSSLQTIVPYAANQEGAPQYISRFAGYAIDGSSSDGSRVLFETRVQLTADAAPGVDNLYVWSQNSHEVKLAGVLPGSNAEAPPGGSFGGAAEWFIEANPFQGGALSGNAVEAVDALTPDASQVFFTAGETGQLYLRRGLAGNNPETLRISRPNLGVVDPNGEKPAVFQQATPRGDRAFFLSSERLTADANTGPSDEGRDLYQWDVGTGSLIDLTPDSTDEPGAQVQGLLGTSEDGTSGYFVARGVLAAGARAGDENLYRFDTTSTPTIVFIATLESGGPYSTLPDRRNWSPISYFSPPIATVQNFSYTRTSRVSREGKTLLFSSVRPLTGYVAANPEGSECFEGLCSELFRYVALPGGGGSLSCISCDPNGLPPLGSALLQSDRVNGGNLNPKGVPKVTFPANLSDDGNRVFFESPDPLVPSDTNGAIECPEVLVTSACQDVYEWEAAGTQGGSCSIAEVAGGCLYLLSSGVSPAPSFFAGASENGNTASILTSSQLVPVDTDEANDVYAVTINGGLATQFVTPSPPCIGEGCLAAPSVPAEAQKPGSSQVDGSGNPKAKKQKVRHHRRKKHKHRRKHRAVKNHKQRKKPNHKQASRDRSPQRHREG